MIPQLTKTYQTESFNIDSRGFLYIKFYRENNYNLHKVELLNKYLEFITNICNSSTPSILVDLRDVYGSVTVSDSCLRLLAKDIRLKTVCNKLAIITNSLPLSININNYIKKHNPNVLTKIYDDIDDAIDFVKINTSNNGNRF